MPDSRPPQPVNLTTWDLSFSNTTFHSWYHPLPEIQDFISDLAKEHSDLVELISIGRTSEQREMTAIKISKARRPAPNPENEALLRPKGAVVIVGAQHAREVRTQ